MEMALPALDNAEQRNNYEFRLAQKARREKMVRAAKLQLEKILHFDWLYDKYIEATFPNAIKSGDDKAVANPVVNTANVEKGTANFELKEDRDDIAKGKIKTVSTKNALLTSNFLTGLKNVFVKKEKQPEVSIPVTPVVEQPVAPIVEKVEETVAPEGITPIAPEFFEKPIEPIAAPVADLPYVDIQPISEEGQAPIVDEVANRQPEVQEEVQAPKIEFVPETPVVPEKTPSKPLEVFSSVSIGVPETKEVVLTADSVLEQVGGLAAEVNELRKQVENYQNKIKAANLTIEEQNAKLNAMSFDYRKSQIENGRLKTDATKRDLQIAGFEAQINKMEADAQKRIEEANANADRRVTEAEMAAQRRIEEVNASADRRVAEADKRVADVEVQAQTTIMEFANKIAGVIKPKEAIDIPEAAPQARMV